MADSITDPNGYTAHRFLECWLIGNIVGAAAYGATITLGWSCLFLLARTSQNTSLRMRRIMMALVVFMCGLATTAFILATGGVVRWSFSPHPQNIIFTAPKVWGEPFSPTELIMIVLATWCSDGFMVWRCVMLYDGVSRPRRAAFLLFVTLLTLASLGIGFCALVTLAPAVQWNRYSMVTLFELISLIVNGSISSLIVFRILYHQRYLRKIFGSEYGSGYTKVLTILIESASLTLILSLVHILLAATFGRVHAADSPENMIVLKLATQINTISTILIIFRVAQGRTWQSDPTNSISVAPNENNLELGRLATLKFAYVDSISTTTSTTESQNASTMLDDSEDPQVLIGV